MVPFQSQSDIRKALADKRVSPQKRLGQNFLIDRNLLTKLVNAAQIQPHDVVLEVGAGTGSLTALLAQSAARVIAAEIDRNLFAILSERLAETDNITLLNLDALASKHQINPQIISAIDTALPACDPSLLLVANLPYQIATPLVANLLLSALPLKRLVFTVQSEVADRFLARPATKAFGPISILAQCACNLRRVAKLPPHVFWPAPAVDSTMLRLDVHAPPFASTHLPAFMNFVRACFTHRRKTLRFNLTKTLSDQSAKTLAPTTDLSRRPETLAVDEWISLARTLKIVGDAPKHQADEPLDSSSP